MQISRAADTPIEPVPSLARPQRASFNWEDASLDRVLRDLCARFECGCRGSAGGLRLVQSWPAPKSAAEHTRGGIRVSLGGAGRAVQATQPVAPPGLGSLRTYLSLALRVDLDSARADRDAYLEGLTALDDLGGTVSGVSPGRLQTTFPAQREAIVRFQDLNPAARSIVWLQGTLVLVARRPASRLELPYPVPGASVQRRFSPELLAAVSGARPAEPNPALEHSGGPAGPLSFASFHEEMGPSLLMRSYRPTDPADPDRSGGFPAPFAVGRSGKSYAGRPSTGGSRTEGDWTLAFSQICFPDASEPLVKLVWLLPGEGRQETRHRFRLDRILIPGVDALPLEWRSLPEGQRLPGTLPLEGTGGATVRSEVRLHDAPAPEGVLEIGFAAPEGDGWAPARWARVGVDRFGVSVLKNITPGRYRVLRRFLCTRRATPRGAPAPSQPAGRWLNSDVLLEVPAAGQVNLQPLHLSATALALRGPAEPAPAGGLALDARTLTRVNGRAAEWEGQSPVSFEERGSLYLSIRVQRNGAPVQGVALARRVYAADDQGTLLAARDEVPYFAPFSPGETRLSFRFSSTHPKAARLTCVEGELLAYTRRRHVQLEVPYPGTHGSTLRRDGESVLVAVRSDTPPDPPKPADGPEPDLLPPVGLPSSAGPQVRFRLCYRNGALQSKGLGEDTVAPTAIGASGAAYRPRGGGGTSGESDGWIVHAHRASYPEAREPLVKLVWEFELWDSPESLGHFRMRDVPLPDPVRLAQALPAPQNPPPVPAARTRPAPRSPVRGGKLMVRVLRDGRPAAVGTVHFGLSAWTGSAWGPLRWTEVLVGGNGLARLDGIRPGRYRLTQRHELDGGARAEVRGPVEITVSEGKEQELPPFRLRPERLKR